MLFFVLNTCTLCEKNVQTLQDCAINICNIMYNIKNNKKINETKQKYKLKSVQLNINIIVMGINGSDIH